jgi:uncharacterized protein YbjQ (UPF0145 family)
MAVMTGLSGNEIYCLRLKGLAPGDLVIGNSVFSMGFVGNLAAAGRGFLGGEVTQITAVIHEGRQEAYARMTAEASSRGGIGITGVSSELRHFHGNIEFLAVGSCVHRDRSNVGGGAGDPGAGASAVAKSESIQFSTSADGQELYCQIDCGFRPIKFVFGNVAYSIGAAGGIIGAFKSMGRGEIKEFSDVFNRTRHLALERITQEAYMVKANAVIGIETRTMVFQGAHEMLMLGTASHHAALPQLPELSGQAGIITSDLTNEEMWNLVNLGYVPLKLVMGTAVYSLGIVGGLKAALKSFSRGEVNELTTLIYDAREHAIDLISLDATPVSAYDVVGIQTHVHEHGYLLEFMAIGTAVKQFDQVTTQTANLPPQAIIRDKDTWIGGDLGGGELGEVLKGLGG